MAEKITSRKALDAMRDQAKAELDVRTGPKETQITVHMGTCGIAAGAREVLAGLADELGHAPEQNVTLRQSGCCGLCDQEPMITVVQKSGEPIRYGNVDRHKAREIIREHVLGGAPVMRYIVKTPK